MGVMLAAIDPDNTIFVAIDHIVSVEAETDHTTRVTALGCRGWTIAQPVETILARLLRAAEPLSVPSPSSVGFSPEKTAAYSEGRNPG